MKHITGRETRARRLNSETAGVAPARPSRRQRTRCREARARLLTTSPHGRKAIDPHHSLSNLHRGQTPPPGSPGNRSSRAHRDPSSHRKSAEPVASPRPGTPGRVCTDRASPSASGARPATNGLKSRGPAKSSARLVAQDPAGPSIERHRGRLRTLSPTGRWAARWTDADAGIRYATLAISRLKPCQHHVKRSASARAPARPARRRPASVVRRRATQAVCHRSSSGDVRRPRRRWRTDSRAVSKVPCGTPGARSAPRAETRTWSARSTAAGIDQRRQSARRGRVPGTRPLTELPRLWRCGQRAFEGVLHGSRRSRRRPPKRSAARETKDGGVARTVDLATVR